MNNKVDHFEGFLSGVDGEETKAERSKDPEDASDLSDNRFVSDHAEDHLL